MTHTILTPYFLDEYRPSLEQLLPKANARIGHELDAAVKLARMAALQEELAVAVHSALGKGLFPLSLAGDCCKTLGVAAGLQRAGIHPTLVWLDAHGDFNTWETTPSGFLGGMPLAWLCGLGDDTLLQASTISPLPTSQVVLSDGRDLDAGEAQLVAQSGILHLPSLSQLLTWQIPNQPLWIHLDMDVLRLQDLGAVAYPAEGGATLAELTAVLERLFASGQVCALSVTPWDTVQDSTPATRQKFYTLLQAIGLYSTRMENALFP